MAEIQLRNVSKRWGGFIGVHKFDLNIADQEFLVLLGPSGCGKSTTMRMIAGLEDVTDGEIVIGDRVVNDLDPKDRDIAMVFQSYGLYPNMNVYENIRFPLKVRKIPEAEHEERVMRASAMVELDEFLHRKPAELSGGQRQRVALARAIVREPNVFLMDEPLSNLDAKLRVSTRAQIKNLSHELKVTTIYVTHDQIEAMTLADRVVVMEKGKVQQVGTPTEIYDRPANIFVASFIGSPAMNLMQGEVRDGVFEGNHVHIGGIATPDGPVTLGFRAEDAFVHGDVGRARSRGPRRDRGQGLFGRASGRGDDDHRARRRRAGRGQGAQGIPRRDRRHGADRRACFDHPPFRRHHRRTYPSGPGRRNRPAPGSSCMKLKTWLMAGTVSLMSLPGMAAAECAYDNNTEVSLLAAGFEAWKAVADAMAECGNFQAELDQEFRTKQPAAFAASPSLYDLGGVSNGTITPLINEGTIRPLDDLIAEYGQGLGDNQKIQIDGKTMAVAMMVNAQHLMYRQDILDELGIEVPQTWDEVLDAAAKIEEAGVVDYPLGATMQAGWNLGTDFVNMFYGYGGTLYNDDSTPAVNSEAGVNALETMKRMTDYMDPEWMGVSDSTHVQQQFQQGEIALANFWASRAGAMNDEAESQVVGKVAAAAAPRAMEGGPPAATIWWDGIVVAQNIPDDEAAAAFQVMLEGLDEEMVNAHNDVAVWLLAGLRAVGAGAGRDRHGHRRSGPAVLSVDRADGADAHRARQRIAGLLHRRQDCRGGASGGRGLLHHRRPRGRHPAIGSGPRPPTAGRRLKTPGRARAYFRRVRPGPRRPRSAAPVPGPPLPGGAPPTRTRESGS